MSSDPTSVPASVPAPVPPAARWSGRVMGGLPALFMLLDGGAKLFRPQPVVKATVELGYPESSIIPMGIALLASTLLYLLPRTSVLGAILLTGYLGGAVATHLRVGNGWFEMGFPVLFGVLLWGGLFLREPRLRTLIPLRR